MQCQKPVDFRSALLLDGGYNNVLSALFSASSLIEHFGGLAYTRSVSEEDLQTPPALLLLFALDFCQDPIRISSVLCIHYGSFAYRRTPKTKIRATEK